MSKKGIDEGFKKLCAEVLRCSIQDWERLLKKPSYKNVDTIRFFDGELFEMYCDYLAYNSDIILDELLRRIKDVNEFEESVHDFIYSFEESKFFPPKEKIKITKSLRRLLGRRESF